MRDNFTADEERSLREALIKGEPLSCPRCYGVLELTPILPVRSVAYVRDRVLIRCGACRLKSVVERR